jgi:V/A-type H+-transporting ATPase subunit K
MRVAQAILIASMIVVGAVALIGTVLLLPAGPALAEDATLAMLLDPEVVKWGYASAAAAAALSAIGAGYAVAQVGSAAVGALAEKPELMGRVLVMVGLAEGIAIYGLIVSILILNRLG